MRAWLWVVGILAVVGIGVAIYMLRPVEGRRAT